MSVNSPAVSTEAVGFVGRTELEVVAETVPEETKSVVSVIWHIHKCRHIRIYCSYIPLGKLIKVTSQ